MNTAWIDIATRMGATIKIEWYGSYTAKVVFKKQGKPLVVGSVSIEALIENLNTALQEDCADEMVKNGDV